VRRGAAGSWGRSECGGVLGSELAWLWSRWRNGRRSQALGLDGNGCYDELVGMGVGGIDRGARPESNGREGEVGDVR